MADIKLSSSARVELTGEDLQKVKELKVGGKVRLVLYGTLKSLNISAGESTEEGADSGSLEMTVSTLKTASNNEIAELFDEEFDG